MDRKYKGGLAFDDHPRKEGRILFMAPKKRKHYQNTIANTKLTHYG